MRSGSLALVVLAAAATVGCKKDEPEPAAAATIASAEVASDGPVKAVAISKSARLAAIGMSAVVYAAPSDSAKKLGYIRLGGVVPRSDAPVGNEGCPGGWYGVAPRGFVCVGKNATLDVSDPLVRAASVRPDTTKPLPYAYGFVRAVAPLYLRAASKDEQLATEFHLENHLKWWERKGHLENKSAIGANDTAHELFNEVPAPPPSDTLGDGVLLGGKTEADPPPFWLPPGQRSIPNVSGFDVLQHKPWFANRARRHTGIAFIGAFDSGDEGNHRRYAITVDMRLLPIDKVKPETGSAFHGVDLKEGMQLPIAFARPCNPNAKGAPKPCVRSWNEKGTSFEKGDLVAPRAFLELSGVQKKKGEDRYLQTKAGSWVRAKDVGVAVAPETWPQAAEKGERWIDVSIEEQTLVLWEGKKPVFVTLVSTGQDGLGDPKTTKSTPLGTFRVKSKHITTTMDSNERSNEAGAKPTAGESPTESDKHAGQFELRDVPYVQYFHEGYAIHSAYWHDNFGLARSHGCVNLAPVDAMRVFRFTDANVAVPEGWHGMNVDAGKGTAVVIHK